MMKRREFLKLCLASGLGRSLSLFGPAFVNQSYQNNSLKQPFSIIHLDGGNDAYNTVVPIDMAEYYRQRPSLALAPGSLLSLSSSKSTSKSYGLNPALKHLHKRFNQGHVAIYLGIGYPNVSFSHHRARQVWQTGEPEQISDDFWAHKRLNLKLKPISVYDFDTHIDQVEKHGKALLNLDKKIGQLDKKGLCFIYSEMGRSLKENSDKGTDHGHSNLAFLVGENVRGGIYGDYTNHENEFVTDLREVYCEIEKLMT